MIEIIIGILGTVVGIWGIFKVISWLVPSRHPDEWDDEDREKKEWWGE